MPYTRSPSRILEGWSQAGGIGKSKLWSTPIPLPALTGTIPAAFQHWEPDGPRAEGKPRVAQQKQITLPKQSCRLRLMGSHTFCKIKSQKEKKSLSSKQISSDNKRQTKVKTRIKLREIM